MKPLIALTFFIIASFLAPSFVRAHEGDAIDAKDVYLEKLIQTKQWGPVHLIVRKNDHVLAQPFTVEIRPQCKQKVANWRELNVVDVTSACKVDLKSVKFIEAKNEIEIMINVPDSERYLYESYRKAGNATPTCLKQSQIHTFYLTGLCD